jgi:hypothetical protein
MRESVRFSNEGSCLKNTEEWKWGWEQRLLASSERISPSNSATACWSSDVTAIHFSAPSNYFGLDLEWSFTFSFWALPPLPSTTMLLVMDQPYYLSPRFSNARADGAIHKHFSIVHLVSSVGVHQREIIRVQNIFCPRNIQIRFMTASQEKCQISHDSHVTAFVTPSYSG